MGESRLSYLATEANPIRGLEKLSIDVVGPLDDSGNSILVLWRGDGQQGQGSQGNVVLAGAEAALVVAIGVQAADMGTQSQPSQDQGVGGVGLWALWKNTHAAGAPGPAPERCQGPRIGPRRQSTSMGQGKKG